MLGCTIMSSSVFGGSEKAHRYRTPSTSIGLLFRFESATDHSRRDNVCDHRVRTEDLPFQNHAQAGLRVHRIVIPRFFVLLSVWRGGIRRRTHNCQLSQKPVRPKPTLRRCFNNVHEFVSMRMPFGTNYTAFQFRFSSQPNHSANFQFRTSAIRLGTTFPRLVVSKQRPPRCEGMRKRVVRHFYSMA